MSRITKDFIIGSEFWVNSANLTLWEILNESRLPDKWKRFDLIENNYKECLIKPINRYVSNLYQKPELLEINYSNNTITLRQKTHAEIWVKPDHDDLYALDKTWQRQFYPSQNKYIDEECFNPTYRFYMPWIIDDNIDVKISSCGDTFKINNNSIKFNKTIMSDRVPEYFIDFKIKKHGPHMVNETYGIIDIGTPMYDILIKLNNYQIEQVLSQYGK